MSSFKKLFTSVTPGQDVVYGELLGVQASWTDCYDSQALALCVEFKAYCQVF